MSITKALQATLCSQQSSMGATAPPLNLLFPSVKGGFLLLLGLLASLSPCLHTLDCKPFFLLNQSFMWQNTWLWLQQTLLIWAPNLCKPLPIRRHVGCPGATWGSKHPNWELFTAQIWITYVHIHRVACYQHGDLGTRLQKLNFYSYNSITFD